MKKAFLLTVCTLSICLTAGLFGCNGDNVLPSNHPVSGGTTDKSDPKAPTTIVSKDITSFDAKFGLYDIWSEDRGFNSYRFVISPDENGVLTASETRSGVSAPADAALLNALQEVIDEYKLALKNGTYRVTAGLPPEFQECHFEAKYASGEKLSFTVNNEPESEWARAVMEVFGDWFALQGDSSLAIPKEAKQVAEFSLELTRDGYSYAFLPVIVREEQSIDGETLLLLGSVCTVPDNQKICGGEIRYPADYYDRISEILLKYTNVLNGSNATYVTETIDPEVKSLEMSITYENGRTLSIRTDGPRRIDELTPVLDELIEYHQSLFSE